MNESWSLKDRIKLFIETFHLGKENPTTVARLSMYFNTPESEIRAILRELNFDRVPVVTCSHGVYMATSETDTQAYSQNLWSRIRAMIERARIVDAIGTEKFLRGQLELFENTREG